MRARLRGRIFAQLSALRHSERGIALPVAMIITVVALGFAAVPIIASVNSQGGDSHNQGGNEALAAAEAGAELAVLHQGQWIADPQNPGSASLACVEEDDRHGAPNSDGWCNRFPAEPGLEPIGTAGFYYQLRPCYVAGVNGRCDAAAGASRCDQASGAEPVQVVSTGVARVGGNEVTKRVEVTACATLGCPQCVLKEREKELLEEVIETEEKTGKTVEIITGPPTTKTEPVTIPPPNVFAKGQIVGVEWLNMNNNAQVYNGGAGSNGYVTMSGSANVCGTVSYGTTFTTDNSSSNKAPSSCTAGRTAGKGTTEYPPITLPAGITTSNSDSRLTGADPVGPNVWQRGNISWNPSNLSLTVTYDQLTLEGTLPYYFCQLTLAGGSKLLSGSGKSIKIYFAPPESCPGLNGGAQLQIANGAYVGADSNHGPGFYFVGSSSFEKSKIELGGGANVSQFIVYAPNSKVVANNGVNLSGVIIGHTLELGGGASINRSGTFTPPSVEEFLSGTKSTTTITVPGTTTTTESKVFHEHKEQRDKLIRELETMPPATTTGLDRNAFVECSAGAAPTANPSEGC